MADIKPKKTVRVADFMSEEEEKTQVAERDPKDQEQFEKSKQSFTLKNLVSEFILKKATFIQQRQGDIKEYYELDENILGEGAYGKVYKGTEKDSKEERAVKIIHKSKIKNYQRFINEVTALRTLDHPNIIKLYELFEDEEKLYLVQEMCRGGELFDQIAEEDHFDEVKAAKIFEQILQSLIYCHKNKICHRDLKPENFMFSSKGTNAIIKLIDFGLSRSFYMHKHSGEKEMLRMQTKAGTAFFMAPEVITKNYSNSCDMWSAGVILYVMLSGYPPYDGDTQEEIFQAVLNSQVEFDDSVWEDVSDEAKDLIMQLLTNEDDRLSAKQALKHPWFKKFLGKKKSKMIQVDHLQRLKKFQTMNKLRKAILTFLASRVSNEDIENQIESFHSLDKNKDGYITVKELQKGLKDSHNFEEIVKIMSSVDTDKNGAIDYNEFIAATLDTAITKNVSRLDMAFKFFDKNGDGVIDQTDMSEALVGEEFKDAEGDIIKGIFNEASGDDNNSITYKDFLRWMSIVTDGKKDKSGNLTIKKKIDKGRKNTIGKSFLEP